MTDHLVPREVELKLRLATTDVERLRSASIVREHTRRVSPRQKLVSTYFDTPDRRLAARGAALRVRSVGKRFIQTLKAQRNVGALLEDRAEWEIEIPTAMADLRSFGDPAVLETTGAILPDELEPVFTTRVHRDVIVLDWTEDRNAPARVALMIDQGQIEAGARSEPLCELELELVEGPPRALFSVAEALRSAVPLAIETSEKSARGYRLATGEAPVARKAGRFALNRDMTIEEGLLAVLRHCLRHWLDNEAAALDGRDVEGVHQLRVALRRLRSALVVFSEVLDREAVKRWNGGLRGVLQALGPARDLDVFLTETLPGIDPNAIEPSVLAPLRAIAEARRRAAYEQVRATLRGQDYADLVLQLVCWIERAGWRQNVDIDLLVTQRRPLVELAARNLDKRHRRARKRGRHFAALDAEARHEVRIALKKLRYAVDFFDRLYPERAARRYGKQLAKLQDELGYMNDAAVAHALVNELRAAADPADREAAALAAGAVIGWHAARQVEHEPLILERWQDFEASTPFWAED
jgi:triphosphatase